MIVIKELLLSRIHDNYILCFLHLPSVAVSIPSSDLLGIRRLRPLRVLFWQRLMNDLEFSWRLLLLVLDLIPTAAPAELFIIHYHFVKRTARVQLSLRQR